RPCRRRRSPAARRAAPAWTPRRAAPGTRRARFRGPRAGPSSPSCRPVRRSCRAGRGRRARATRRAYRASGRGRGYPDDPRVAVAIEVQVLGAVVGDDAEHGLVVLGARLVDHLHELEVADLGLGPFGERRAHRRLEQRALPALVGGPGEGERLVDGLQLGAEGGLVRPLPAAGDDVPADDEDGDEHDDDKDDDLERGHAPDYSSPRADYSITLRDARCAPTFRFTRWSALSTVFVSQ